jgi:Fe-S cluster biogenesis protein NfuA
MRFPFSDEELFPAVERVVESVRHTLQNDGGDIELLRVRQTRVFVRLKGACASCGSSALTLKGIVERALRANIHPEMNVVNETANETTQA